MGYARNKRLAVLIVLTMILSLFPVFSGAVNGDPAPNFAFVPNANEASVSKIDLTIPQEIARYSTVEPRTGTLANDRVSRLALEHINGHAWALNTMTGSGFDYATAQGSVARISATPVPGEDPGVNTSNSGGLAGIVTNDVRVTRYNLGDPGDGPRTINIVEDGGEVYLWIGYYNGHYFEKLWYDEENDELDSLGTIDLGTYTPYYALIDNDGMMWVTSRNASPYPSTGVPAVLRFDTNNLGDGYTVMPYDLPGKSGENPYALMLDNNGCVWVSDGSNWSTNQIRYFAVYCGDGVTYVSSGTSQAMRGFMQDGEGNIWATTIDGKVLKGTLNGTWSFAEVLTGWGELAGIGMDAQGFIWVVRHGGDTIRRFDPADPGAGFIDVPVGDGPYAYDNFIVVEPPKGKICGTKFETFHGAWAERVGLEEWTILLYKDAPAIGTPNELDAYRSTLTDEDGNYCFTDLPYGTYYVYEVIEDCYAQVTGKIGQSPDYQAFYEVILDSEEFEVTGIDFMNRRGAIGGKKAYWDGTGSFSPTPGLGGWEIYLFNRMLDEGEELSDQTEGYVDHVTTGAGGDYLFTKLCPGTYYVYEKMQDGWVQTYPESGFHTVTLTTGQVVRGKHFGNMEEPDLYSICGFKYAYGTETGLEGWKIYLHEEELTEGADPSVGALAMTTTDATGKYCFNELPAGTYFIYEEIRDGFKPHPAFFEVTLPGGETDLEADEPMYYNFENEKEMCETAWGWNAGANANNLLNGVTNWGWNFGPLGEGVVEFELWASAGQNILSNGEQVGTGTIDYSGDTVRVTLSMFEGFRLSEYHLWVGATNLPITGQRRGVDVYTSAPGSFANYMPENSIEVIAMDEEGATYEVTGFNTDGEGNIYVAVHIVACWFPSDIE